MLAPRLAVHVANAACSAQAGLGTADSTEGLSGAPHTARTLELHVHHEVLGPARILQAACAPVPAQHVACTVGTLGLVCAVFGVQGCTSYMQHGAGAASSALPDQPHAPALAQLNLDVPRPGSVQWGATAAYGAGTST